MLVVMHRLLGISTMSPMQADGRLWPPQQLEPVVQVKFSVMGRRVEDCKAVAADNPMERSWMHACMCTCVRMYACPGGLSTPSALQ